MANSVSEQWSLSHPSSAFLLKCAKEKEKLRSKLQKQLQEHMLNVLEEGLYSNIHLGLNTGIHDSTEGKVTYNLPQFLPAHKAILRVRTPAFLEYVTKNEDTNREATFYQTHLLKAQLQEFLKKTYTDDDIRRQECETLRLSKTYATLFQESKNSLRKHANAESFECESLNSEHFTTLKSNPITTEKEVISFPNMFHSSQSRHTISEGPLKPNCSIQNRLFTTGDNTGELVTPFFQRDISNGCGSKLDDVNDEKILDLTLSNSLLECNSTDLTSTSIDIGESDFIMEDDGTTSSMIKQCKFSNLENDESSMQIDSEDSPIPSGMVRSGTFDLSTQASLEDLIEHKTGEGLVEESVEREDNSNNNFQDRVESGSLDENYGFFLHDPPENSLKNIISGDHTLYYNGNPISLENLPPIFRRNDGSMSDSGFLSFSLLSDGGVSNPFSNSSFIVSNEEVTGSAWNEELQSNLEKSKQLSGSSLFPFYIDINNSTEKCDEEEKKCSVEKSHRNNQVFTRSSGKLVMHPQASRISGLMKAQSTPHLDTFKESLSAKKDRPRSCYMYIDLDSVEAEKTDNDRGMGRAPSSVSMFVDLREDFGEMSEIDNSNFGEKPEVLNFINTNENMKDNKTKVFGSGFEIAKNNPQEKHSRKLSDSFLGSTDSYVPSTNYSSLRRPNENMSDSALNYIVNKEISFRSKSSEQNYPVMRSKSAHKSCEFFPHDLQKKAEHSAKHCFESGYNYLEQSTKDLMPNEILHMEKNPRTQPDHDLSRKNDFNNESGLLPMSPIFRRKAQIKEKVKSSQPPIIKASTKPQDIDAMRFPRPLKDESSNEIYSKCTENESTLQKHPETNSSMCRKLDLHDSNYSVHKISLENEISNEKFQLESTSRSESSAFTASAETSSSGKICFSEKHQDDTRSPLSFSLPYEFEDDAETVYSEVSDFSSSLGGMSSIASLERRWREGYNIVKDANSSGMHNVYRLLESCSKLGEDLLRMFLEEIDTDVAIATEGKQIKAHRCILTARCKYFSSAFMEEAFENTGIVNLQGFTYASVHFALCHVYGGVMNLPKGSNISELALLSEVLSLDTLVDVLILHLKTHYCHFFHKPCSQCIQGVLECLPLSMFCGFINLRDKCVRWLGRHFTRTWPNKVFASLPEDLRELTFQSTVKNLNIDTVIDMTMNADRLITTMPHVKWSEPVFGLVTKLLQECIHFMADNFNRILSSEGFLILGKGHSWNCLALEDDIISAIELMTPDVACKSCVKLSQILSLAESDGYSEYGEFTQNFIDLLHKVNRHCERYLIHNANKVVHCQSWACLTAQVQKKIRDAAVIVFEFEKPTARPPRLSSLQRKLNRQREGENMSFFESATYPKFGQNDKFRDSLENIEKSLQLCKVNKEPVSDRKNIEANIKKIVSPITEESQNNDLRKESIDLHDEDSLKEMQELPHDHSQTSQNICADVSQLSSGNIVETEENLSGTQGSDNPDSLDTHEEIVSDSKDEFGGSQFEDVNSNASPGTKPQECSALKQQSSTTGLYSKLRYSDSPSRRVVSKKSPVKSMVPLPKPHNYMEKDQEPVCKDLVAEIDADSRMVTHCLQEAEMLEQQLSRKLLHQQKLSSTKTFNYSSHAVSESCRSPRSVGNKVQKSQSSSHVKLLSTSSQTKSSGKLAPSSSNPHVPRLLHSTETPRETKPNKKPPQSPKSIISVAQKSFRVVDGINATRQISPSKRVSTRSMRSKSSNISAVRDIRVSNSKGNY